MSLYYNAKQKLRNIKRTIDKLLDGDFPLSSGQNALMTLRGFFSKLENKVDRAHLLHDQDSERHFANIVNVKVYQSLPILGFILRSTNVRNAFEFLDPLQDIADAILLGKPQLLLSSEWDYVPFAYPQSLEDLRSFVLIGMPASEAASALLVPLAGHELGHAVWRNRGIGSGAHAELQSRCVDLYNEHLGEFKKHFPDYDPNKMFYNEILPEAIALSVEYAVFQAEELFCDMFAYAIFGESYLYAFSYILAPGSGRPPGSKYPSYKTRISVLRNIGEAEGIALPDMASLEFVDVAPRGNPQERFIVKMAETSVEATISSLWSYVIKLITDGDVGRPSADVASGHLEEFRLGIPAHKPSCLGDIINAGWMYYKEAQNGYDLRLMSVGSPDGLLNDGRNLVIIAIVGTGVHIRIFDANGEKVVDAPENELISGETLTALKKHLDPLPDETGLSQEQKQNFIRDAASIAGHTPQDANESLVEEVDRLNEMILKTVEVLEYRRRTRNGT